jgi:hypothetical protein
MNEMIKNKMNNMIILIDLYKIDFKNWMRISKYVIKKYGLNEWFKYTYYVLNKEEYEEIETQERTEYLMKM